MFSNTGAVISMTKGMMNATLGNFSNSTNAATNTTSWSEQFTNTMTNLSEHGNLPQPAAAGVLLLGLAVAGAAACLTRAVWHGKDDNQTQPRLASQPETSERGETGDVQAKTENAEEALIESASQPTPGAAKKAPAQSAPEVAEQRVETQAAEAQEMPEAAAPEAKKDKSAKVSANPNKNLTEAPSQKAPAADGLTTRTQAAIALNTKGFSNSDRAALRAPREAKMAMLKAKQEQGMAGKQEAQARKAEINQARQAGLAQRRAAVQAERARRAALRQKPANSPTLATTAPRSAATVKQASADQRVSTDLTRRTQRAIDLATRNSSPSAQDSVNNPRRAVAQKLRDKQQVGITGRQEHAARQAQIKLAKEAELARNRERVAAIRAGRK